MTYPNATITQLYTIAFYDDMATPLDRQLAAQEIVRRMHRQRKPYRNHQQRIRKALPKW